MAEIEHGTRAKTALNGLVDALDTVIGEGAVVAGDVTIALADVDLIKVDLRLLLAGVEGQPATTPGAA
jgi:hypothetical protein